MTCVTPGRRAGDADSWGGAEVAVLQGIIEPKELLRQLGERHVPFLTGTGGRILAFIEEGYSNEEVAELMEVAPATVRRHVADLCHRVFDLTDIPPQREKLRSWIPVHHTCCTLGVQELIENDQKLG